MSIPDDAHIEGALDIFDVPGVSVAFLDGGKVAASMALGAATLEPRRPVTPTTIFEAASVSKPVFAWIVMKLVEDGVIELDRPIVDDLEYPRIVDRVAYAKLTPRMILTHRTGLPNWVGTEVNIHDRTAPIPFEHPPGAAHSYSGEAFQLLQSLVESKTGRSLQSLFVEYLGDVMPNSTFTHPLRGDVVESRGYAAASDPESGRGMDDIGSNPSRGAAAYSLATTADDLANFLALVCRRERMRPATYDAMFEPQATLPPGEGPPGSAYGLGWIVMSMGDETIVGHTGNNGEYRAIAFVSLTSGDGIAALVNSASGQTLLDLLAEPPPPTATVDTPPATVDTSTASSDASPDGSPTPIERFDAFWRAFNENYALFDVKHIDWDRVRRVYRPRVTSATTDDELWSLLTEMIDLLNDAHVTLWDGETGRTERSGRRGIGIGPFESGRFSWDVVQSSLVSDADKDADGRIRWGRLPHDVGYLRITGFDDVPQSSRAVDRALGVLADCQGLVVDVRHNGGGDDRVGRAIACRFADQTRDYMTVAVRRIGTMPPKFAPPITWKVRPRPGGFVKPVAVLVDDRSISAAENFAMAMKVLPHATLIGETTCGVMADAIPHPLPGGWGLTIPVNVFRDSGGVCWEGIGITPDLSVVNTAEEIDGGTDRQLRFALDWLRRQPSSSFDAGRCRIRPRPQDASDSR